MPRPRARLDGTLLIVHGHREDDEPRISQECVSRVGQALQLARTERIGAVLMCGAGVPGFPSEASQMAALWGLPEVPVYMDERSTNAAEVARQAAHWSSILGATRMVVVSSS